NPGLRASAHLLPDGATGVLACRYSARPPGTGPLVLDNDARVGLTGAQALAKAIDGISTLRGTGPGLGVNCGSGPPSVTVLVFSFSSRNDVDLWYTDAGCPTLDNGLVRIGSFRAPFIQVEDLINALASSQARS
ncbi:MAG: hypothetical protein ACYCTI_13080, partial [Acidimicrobiales bacterium]